MLKLGGPFLQTWQKKHLKLYPNRLEFYHKNRDGQVVRGKGVEVCIVTFLCSFHYTVFMPHNACHDLVYIGEFSC